MQKIEGTLTYDTPERAAEVVGTITRWYARNDAVVGGGVHADGPVVHLSLRLHQDLPKKTATQVLDAFRDRLDATSSDLNVGSVDVDADGQNVARETVYSEEELAEFARQQERNEAQVADGLSLDFED